MLNANDYDSIFIASIWMLWLYISYCRCNWHSKMPPSLYFDYWEDDLALLVDKKRERLGVLQIISPCCCVLFIVWSENLASTQWFHICFDDLYFFSCHWSETINSTKALCILPVAHGQDQYTSLCTSRILKPLLCACMGLLSITVCRVSWECTIVDEVCQ